MQDFSFGNYGAQQSVQELASQDNGSDFEIMPKHKNQLVIDEMEINQATSGSINLKVVTSIVGDQFNGRKMWNNINLVKKDGNVNEISQRQLGSLALAVGFTGDQLNNPLELLNYASNPFEASVGVEKGGPKQGGGVYDDKNVFSNPKPIQTAQPMMNQGQGQGGFQQQQQAPQQQAPNNGFQQQSAPQGGFQPQQRPQNSSGFQQQQAPQQNQAPSFLNQGQNQNQG